MQRTCLSLIAVSTVLMAALPVGAQPSWPDLSQPAPVEGGGANDAAIVVGIENYAFIEDIPGAVQNANDWYAWLTRTRKVPLGKVALLRDNDVTKESLVSAVRAAVDKVGDSGTLWLVFIGHGAPSKDGTDGLLLGVDTMQTADSVYARGLRQSELLDALGQGSQERTLVVLDACFSGKSGYGDALVDGLQPLVPQYAVQSSEVTVISAGQADQFAGPLPGVARPAFSYLLLGGLRGWADLDGDRQVTPNEAVSYANDAMYALLRDRTQNPQLHGPGGDAVVSRGGEQGPDLTSMVLALGSSSGSATGARGTISTGLDVDLAAKAREAEQLRHEREALEQREREIQAELEADRLRRLDQAESDLQDSARSEWLALAPLLESPSPESADVVELYVEKYGEASVTVDGETTPVEVAYVDEARDWLLRTTGGKVGWFIAEYGYEMVSVDAGEFIMGSTKSEGSNSGRNAPHSVRITQPFTIGSTEVTQALYEAIMGENPTEVFIGGEGIREPTYPVSTVKWVEAVEFCNRLSKKEGLRPAYRVSGADVEWNRDADGYRLPTEAEWEYAARAGTYTKYTGTDDKNEACRYGNVKDPTLAEAIAPAIYLNPDFPCRDRAAGPVQGGSYAPNDWGLYDMTGNVGEWVWDWYGEYPTELTSDPIGPDTGDKRVERGGDHRSSYTHALLSNRSVRDPSRRNGSPGFRLVRSRP